MTQLNLSVFQNIEKYTDDKFNYYVLDPATKYFKQMLLTITFRINNNEAVCLLTYDCIHIICKKTGNDTC